MTAGPESYAVRAHVDAWQVTAENLDAVAKWCGGQVLDGVIHFDNAREESDIAELGDWVVKGATDGFFTLQEPWFTTHYYREDRHEPVTYGCLTGEPLRITRREVRS